MEGLEKLEELDEFGITGQTSDSKGVWIVKNLSTFAVAGFRHDSYAAAQLTLNKVQKEHPEHKFEIRKIR